MTLASLPIWVGLALPFDHALAAEKEIVVVARLLKAERVPACGGKHSVADVLYERASEGGNAAAEADGEFAHRRFIGIHSCPDMTLRLGVVRLTLARDRPPLWPAKLEVAPFTKGLPRFYVIKVETFGPPETRAAGQLLELPRAELARRLQETSELNGVVQYGPNLSVRYRQDRAVEVTAQLGIGMLCNEAAKWMGFNLGLPRHRKGGCTWPADDATRRLAKDREATWEEDIGTFRVRWVTALPEGE